MTQKKKTKEYTNGELTIVWEPAICSHSEVCINCLPEVYNPYGKPWITIEKATTSQLKEQLAKCPSGALSYYMNADENKAEALITETQVKVMTNGPLIVSGTIEVIDGDGNIEVRGKKTSFCRCGASEKQPYCDGSHKKIGFKG